MGDRSVEGLTAPAPALDDGSTPSHPTPLGPVVSAGLGWTRVMVIIGIPLVVIGLASTLPVAIRLGTLAGGVVIFGVGGYYMVWSAVHYRRMKEESLAEDLGVL